MTHSPNHLMQLFKLLVHGWETRLCWMSLLNLSEDERRQKRLKPKPMRWKTQDVLRRARDTVDGGISFTPRGACCVSSTVLGGDTGMAWERRRGRQRSPGNLSVPWPQAGGPGLLPCAPPRASHADAPGRVGTGSLGGITREGSAKRERRWL